MINTIRVSEKRGLFPERLNLGTIGENNATELVFVLPESLVGYAAELVCETSKGSFVFSLQEYRFALPQELLTDSTLNVQLVLRDNNKVVWKSVPCTFTLNPTLDDSNENFAEQFRNEGREEYRAELADAVQELTGDDVSSDSWDELTSTVTALPLETEDKINARAEYSLLTHVFEKATTPPNILSGTMNYNYDTVDDKIQYIKLPYIYTPNVDWSVNTKINANIVECGFDVSGSTAKKVTSLPSSFLQSASKLERIKLTGLGNLTSLCYLFYCPSIEEAELYFDGDVDSHGDNYWKGFCYFASNLRALYGDPIDMSKGTNYISMFTGCESLRYIRFVPNSIGLDLDLSSCTQLYNDTGTLLSILNGVKTGLDIELRFNATVKPFLSSLRCRIGESGLYELSESDTDPTIQSALVSKGVTVS